MSDNKINIENALAMIAEALDESKSDVQLDTKLKSLDGWDSMGGLMLMAEFDERFEITLKESQMRAFESVSEIIDVLREHDALDE